MSPDCFNQCPECDLILSVPSSKEKVNCPRCEINERRVVAMRLVALDVPLRSHFAPEWDGPAKAA